MKFKTDHNTLWFSKIFRIKYFIRKSFPCALLLTLLNIQQAASQTIDHWETAVFNNDTWRYFAGTSEPDTAWRTLAFNTDSWQQGPGGFGYSDNDDNTIIPQCTSVFIRIIFNVPDTAAISKALLSMDYDDAFVAYLNDIEIGRAGITGTHPAYDQPGADHEATMYAGGVPESFFVDKKLLRTSLLPGDNVLAIQIHNTSLSSSDLSSNAWLSFGLNTPANYFRTVPSWFSVPVEFKSSNLPIVIINTDGRAAIPDNPRIMADMKIIYRGNGLRNYLADKDSAKYLNYNGRIDIEIRGSSSQVDPKKQYGLSTKMSDGLTNNNISILDLPKDNDWILNGLVFETSLMRNYLCYNLSRSIGEYASRTVYCEVIINGEYEGLYLLLEKVKQSKERVNVVTIDQTDNSYPDLTGGYITKADKTTGDDPVAWTMPSSPGYPDVTFMHELPKPENVTPLQNSYIKFQFEKLSTTASSGNTSFADGYPSIIDLPSFIDYMVINELSANADAYQYSTYYHKDRNGKLRAGPLWDQDLTFGYDLFFWGLDRSKTDTWQFSNSDNEGPAFWKNLFRNPDYKCRFSRRWNQLIQPDHPLNETVIDRLIDQTDSVISEAVVRENARWGTSLNHTYEIQQIKNFVHDRIRWMTNNIGSYSACSNLVLPPLVITKIMYFPDTTFKFPDSKDQEFIEISNTGSTTQDLTGVYFMGTGFVYQFPPAASIKPGEKIILASNNSVFIQKYGVHPYGQYSRNLSHSGETLMLADGFGDIIDSVNYSAMPPWPDANGNGYYLNLPDPVSDNSLASNWTAANNVITGAEENRNDVFLRLYPSPVENLLQIEGAGKITTLQLYNLQGYILKEINVDSDRYTLDMRSLLPGMYLIRVNMSGNTIVRKVMKE